MGLKEAVVSVFSKYATFSGRATRSEYWFFYLFNVIMCLGLVAYALFSALSSKALLEQLVAIQLAPFFIGSTLLQRLYRIWQFRCAVFTTRAARVSTSSGCSCLSLAPSSSWSTLSLAATLAITLMDQSRRSSTCDVRVMNV